MHLAVQVVANSTLKLCGSLADKMRQVLNVVTGGDAESSNKVLGRVLQVSVTVINRRKVILGPAEVSIAGDRSGTIKFSEPLLGFRLGVGVEAVTAKELIRRDTLLGTEASLRLGEFLLYLTVLVLFFKPNSGYATYHPR